MVTYVLITLVVILPIITWIITKKKISKEVVKHGTLSSEISKLKEKAKELKKDFATVSQEFETKSKEFADLDKRTTHLQELELTSEELQQQIDEKKENFSSMKNEIEESSTRYTELQVSLQELKAEIDLFNRIKDFIDFGIYEEPEYMFETSERFKFELQKIRDKQKELIKDNKAIEIPDGISISGSSKTGSSVLNGQAKLMLQALNLECDYLISKVKTSNFPTTLERIEKSAARIENLSASALCGITDDYIKLKFEECKINYQYQLKLKEEKEEQKLIREQMKEEAKAIKEYEIEIAKAEKEEHMFQKLLLKAREQLKTSGDLDKPDLELKISMLEEQLKDAEERRQRAVSMAEQTKKGHVYVISNIGAFGEEVYKIGLTRRLEPLDRVKELSGPSVPFKFDVHAIIYSDDSPALETHLHREFNNRKVNVVNSRKEFFNVSLDEIIKAVENTDGKVVYYRKEPLAEEYFDTLRLMGTFDSKDDTYETNN